MGKAENVQYLQGTAHDAQGTTPGAGSSNGCCLSCSRARKFEEPDCVRHDSESHGELVVEALEVAMVRTKARIVEGDAGKVICKEAERLKPVAVVMGTRGRSLMQSVIQGSVSEYCFHNCKTAPIIIVPGKEEGEQSVL